MNHKTCLKITYDRFLSPQFSYAQIVSPNRMSRQVCGWKVASGPSVHQSVRYQTGKPALKADHHCISLSTITLQQHAATVNGWCLCCKPISKSVSCQTTTACSSSQWLKSAASRPVKSVPHQTPTATSSSQCWSLLQTDQSNLSPVKLHQQQVAVNGWSLLQTNQSDLFPIKLQQQRVAVNSRSLLQAHQSDLFPIKLQ